MKKLLAILLIAIAACETVQDIDLQSIFDDIVDKVKDAWDNLTDELKNAANYLKDKGIYDTVKDKLISAGKTAAIALCTPYLGPTLCSLAVEALCQLCGIDG